MTRAHGGVSARAPARGAQPKRPRGVPPPPELNPALDRKEVRRLFVVEGLGPTEIARRTGYTYACVNKALREQGLRRPKPPARTGKRERKLYSLWKRMRTEARRHGGRGAGIDSRWQSFRPFYEWARTNGYRPGLYLVFADRDGGFTPRNCRFVTPKEFVARSIAEGTRAAARIEAFGERKTVREWLRDRTDVGELARRLGVTRATVLQRLGPVRARTRAQRWTAPPRIRALLYRKWHEMLEKCRNPEHKQYYRIGARGIGVCPTWRSFDAFARWAIEVGYEPGRWLTRKVKSRDYSPANCVWLQERDARRQTRPDSKPPRMRWPITAFGETRSPMAWAADRRCPVSYQTLLKRLHQGWSAEEAITSEARVKAGGPSSTAIRAFGQTKSLAEWGRDRRCKVRTATLRMRLLKGIAPEKAIATPGYRLTR